MIGKGTPLENMKIDVGIQANSTSSSIYTPSFSMKGVHRAIAICQVGANSATGDVVHFSILGGDSTTAPASMSSITNATLDIGTSSTKGTIIKASKLRIHCLGSAIASALSLTFGTSTFETDSTASNTAKEFVNGVSSAVAKSLTTMIQSYYPNLNTTYSGTGTTAAYVDVDIANQMSSMLYAATTACATAGGLAVQSLLAAGAICLGADDLTSTASSFTNFAVLANCTGSSAVPLTVTILREMAHSPSSDNQGWGIKRDMSTSAMV